MFIFLLKSYYVKMDKSKIKYSTILENGSKVFFSIYDYHYQNPELKKQFDGTYVVGK